MILNDAADKAEIPHMQSERGTAPAALVQVLLALESVSALVVSLRQVACRSRVVKAFVVLTHMLRGWTVVPQTLHV